VFIVENDHNHERNKSKHWSGECFNVPLQDITTTPGQTAQFGSYLGNENQLQIKGSMENSAKFL